MITRNIIELARVPPWGKLYICTNPCQTLTHSLRSPLEFTQEGASLGLVQDHCHWLWWWTGLLSSPPGKTQYSVSLNHSNHSFLRRSLSWQFLFSSLINYLSLLNWKFGFVQTDLGEEGELTNLRLCRLDCSGFSFGIVVASKDSQGSRKAVGPGNSFGSRLLPAFYEKPCCEFTIFLLLLKRKEISS